MNEFYVPSPEDFEVDEESYAPTPKERAWWYLRNVIIVIVLGGLLYISGIYQGTLFHRTSQRTQEALPSIVEGDVITVPLRVVVALSTGQAGSQRSEENVLQLVENASAIWNQANIELTTDDILFSWQTDEVISLFIHDPSVLIESFANPDFGGVYVFLVEGLSGLNGIAFTYQKSVAVADFTTTIDYRTLAHEVGHVLGLSHTTDRGDLMFSGSYGTDLSTAEAKTARGTAALLRDSI